MDDAINNLKASDAAVNEKLRDTDANVRSENDLAGVLGCGRVGSVMVHEADLSGCEQRLKARGVTVYGNRKVPRGMAAVYDKSEKMIGVYRLGA